MASGRQAETIALSDEERTKLSALAGRRTSRQAEAQRARIVLAAARGLSNSQIAREERLSRPTVSKWRRQFARARLAGLYDAPRSGAPRQIDDAKVEAILTRTLEKKPAGARTHWSSRLLAKEVGLSADSIQRIWRAFGLAPHRSDAFKLSADPMFVEKVRDVVGLYLNPPVNAMVLCVDEKSQCQALERTQPNLPLRAGSGGERRTHDYTRHGTTSLFAAYNVANGQVIGQCHRQHRAKEFIGFLSRLDQQLPPSPDGAELHLILDNYATHKTPAVKKWLLGHPRFVLHFTPTSASWLNLVERFFALLTEQAIRRGSFTSVPQLESLIHAYVAEHNKNPKPFVWTKTADTILQKLAHSFS